MRRTLTRTMVALGVIALLAACGDSGGDDSPEELQADIAEEFKDSDMGLTDDQADCFAGVVVDEIGAEELQDVDFSAAEAPEGLEEQFTAAATIAIDECEIDVADLGG